MSNRFEGLGGQLLKDKESGIEVLVRAEEVKEQKLMELLEIRRKIVGNRPVGHWSEGTITRFARQIQILEEYLPELEDFIGKIRQTVDKQWPSTYNGNNSRYLIFRPELSGTTKKVISAYNKLVELMGKGMDERSESYSHMLS